MYILYNQDGSVKTINLTDFIQKGNNNVNSIFLAIENKKNDSWVATICFTLPTGEKTIATPSAKTEEINGMPYSGWEVGINSSITIYEGLVDFSISVLNLQNQVLFTYRNRLTINPSIIVPDTTTISYQQYISLLQYIQSEIGASAQNGVAIINDVLTNINGVSLDSHYGSEEVRINDVDGYKITYDGTKLTKEQAGDYLEFMNGSRFVPVYNANKPQYSYLIDQDGACLKPLYDETNGLVLYATANPFVVYMEQVEVTEEEEE